MAQCQCADFGLRQKVLLHVDLAESFPQLLIRSSAATLPARANFLGAGKNAAVEGKILLHEGIGEKRGGTMDELPAMVGPPIGKRNAGQHTVESFEKIGLSDVDLRELRIAYRLKVGVPGKARGQGLRVRHAHPLVSRAATTAVR